MAVRLRPGQRGEASHGSRTLTIHDAPAGEAEAGPSTSAQGEEGHQHPQGVLRLRGGGNTRRVVWSEGTVDNEGMGKKKSKICCIYHKPKAFDESSDESSSSSGSSGESDSDSDGGASSSASSDSINASKALRERRASARKHGKAKAAIRGQGSQGMDGEQCHDEKCNHARQKVGTSEKTKRSSKSRGSRTVTIVEPAPDEVETGDDGGGRHPNHSSSPTYRQSLPNAYERGTT